jgi:Fe-S cluster assembly protein SufB
MIQIKAETQKTMTTQPFGDISRETLDRSDRVTYSNILESGISERVVRQIWESNDEPDWMLDVRLRSLRLFQEMKTPTW